jgi:hypothetical protein
LNTSTLTQTHKRATKLLPWQCTLFDKYQIEICTSVNDLTDDWDTFATKHEPQFCKKIIGIAEIAALADFSYYYVSVKDDKSIIGLLYFQSIVVRKDYYPDFSNLSFAAKNLYCLISSHNYNLLVNGHIFSTDIPGAVVAKNNTPIEDLTSIFEKVVLKVKRASCSSIFIIKDAHPFLQKQLLKSGNKYKIMPDDVLMEMSIPKTWQNIDDYIDALSKKYAVRAKKLEESISRFELIDFSEQQIIENKEVLHALYMNVISRSSFKMGVLNMSFFAGLKKGMKDNFVFKVWILNQEIVGFSTYIKLGNHMELYYIGIDYKVNKSHHLYQCILQQGIKDAIVNHKPILKLGRTAYEAKAIAGAKPVVKSNYFQISNPLLKIGYRYSADYFVAENSTNWQVRNPFRV